MSTPIGCEQRFELGAYLLDALDSRDRAAYQRHLVGCRECRAEFAELSDLPELLSHVDRATVLADPVLSESARTVRRAPEPEQTAVVEFDAREQPRPAKPPPPEKRHLPPPGRRFLVTALAALVLVIGGVLALTSVLATSSNTATVKLVAAPAVAASGTAEIHRSGSATSLSVSVTGIPAGTTCEIFVNGKNGTYYTGQWIASYAGEGHWTGPAPVPPGQMRGVVIRDKADNQVLLSGRLS